jgi:hypothetical protein
MNEAQAWEQLYGRRSPDVRVLGREPGELDGDRNVRADERGYVERGEQRPPESEAHAA